MSFSGDRGRGRRGGGGRFVELPRPPVAVDVGCSCRAPRLLSALVASLRSHARGLVGGGKKPRSPHASSSAWSSSTATAFSTSSAALTSSSTAASSADHHHHHYSSWGPATYAACGSLYGGGHDEAEQADEARRQVRRRSRRARTRQQQQQRRRCGGRRDQPPAGRARMAAPAAAALGDDCGEEMAVAVEVESAAPYEDFRESMVAMVTEKEMYAWEDLNALLHQFLALNSPRHHPLILSAFADLWAPRRGPFCPPSPCLL